MTHQSHEQYQISRHPLIRSFCSLVNQLSSSTDTVAQLLLSEHWKGQSYCKDNEEDHSRCMECEWKIIFLFIE